MSKNAKLIRFKSITTKNCKIHVFVHLKICNLKVYKNSKFRNTDKKTIIGHSHLLDKLWESEGSLVQVWVVELEGHLLQLYFTQNS